MANWLSKIFPLALLPLGLSLFLLLVGLIVRWRWLETPWLRQPAADASSADAIFVFSGGRHPAPGAAKVSEWHDPDRFLAGLDLYRQGKAPRLLFSGGASPFRPGQPPEGQRYFEEAEQLGIPAAAMQSTKLVVNTAEEAIAIHQLLQGSNPSTISPSILLVPVHFICAVRNACSSVRV